MTLFGGLAPFTITGFTRLTGSSLTPAFYLIFAGLFSLVLVAATRRGHRDADDRRLASPRSPAA